MKKGYTISINLQRDVELCFTLDTAMEKTIVIKPLLVQEAIHDIRDYSISSLVCFFLP
jgi:hypothetical protein